jgi:hypothetical protein
LSVKQWGGIELSTIQSFKSFIMWRRLCKCCLIGIFGFYQIIM